MPAWRCPTEKPLVRLTVLLRAVIPRNAYHYEQSQQTSDNSSNQVVSFEECCYVFHQQLLVNILRLSFPVSALESSQLYIKSDREGGAIRLYGYVLTSPFGAP